MTSLMTSPGNKIGQNFRYNFGKKVCRELKMAAISKILKY